MIVNRTMLRVAFGRLSFVVLVAGVLSVSLLAAPKFFIASFERNVGHALIDADHAFVVENGIIHVRQPVARHSMVCCLNDRHYIATERADYLAHNWTYEVTFRSPAHAPDEVLFVGMGQAVRDPEFYTEPANSVYFAIAQGITGASQPGWGVRFHAHEVGMWTSTYPIESIRPLGGPGGGTFTARIRKIGQAVTFEIVGTDIVITVPDIVSAAPFLTRVPVRLFFGSAQPVYAFDDMRVLPERPFHQ